MPEDDNGIWRMMYHGRADTEIVELHLRIHWLNPLQVRIPENLDFKMTLDMKKVIYDQILLLRI